jgi:hypothetical protein
MSRKIFRLDVPVEFDFTLLAVVSSLKDYRLCYELNKTCRLKFVKQTRSSLHHPNHLSLQYNYFRYRSRSDREEIILIQNKGYHAILIPEMKNIDYFMLIRHLPDQSINSLITAMNQIENIAGVYRLDPKKIRSAENFLMFE